jgi:hypothetical protein
VNKAENKIRISLATESDSRLLSPTMYLVQLRAHLSRGRIALGEVIDAVSDVLPAPRSQKSRGLGKR